MLSIQTIIAFGAMAFVIVKANAASGSEELVLVFAAVVLGLSGALRLFALIGSWLLRDKLDL